MAEAPAGLSAGRSLIFVIGSGLVALVASLIIWPVVRFIITIAHDGSHAMTASLMGGEVEKIEVYRSRPGQARGATFYSKPAGPLGRFFSTMAGYLGPSGFGLTGAVLLVMAMRSRCCGSVCYFSSSHYSTRATSSVESR